MPYKSTTQDGLCDECGQARDRHFKYKAGRDEILSCRVGDVAGFPKANEPGPYGIGCDHWPGLGKLQEEMNELGVELAKLLGSGGDRYHWTGDLVVRIRGEIADVLAALDFFQEANPILGDEEHTTLRMSGRQFMVQRRHWKHELFRAWARNAPPEQWPQPEQFNLPPRDEQ